MKIIKSIFDIMKDHLKSAFLIFLPTKQNKKAFVSVSGMVALVDYMSKVRL